MSRLDRLVNRLAAQTRADAATLAAGACPTCTPEQRSGLAFVPGDRVVDLVTGQRGVIRAGTTEAYLVPPPER